MPFSDGGLKQARTPISLIFDVEYLGRYDQIALELETDPVIVALLDNLSCSKKSYTLKAVSSMEIKRGPFPNPGTVQTHSE